MPKESFEIIFHARAGQGAKSAAELIVEAALDEDRYVQSFPEYGPERSGAPMKAFSKISKKPIRGYTTVKHPDALVVIDQTVLSKDLVKDVSKDCMLLVNTHKDADWVRKKTDFKGKIYTINATQIAIDTLGKDMPNTVMLGALARLMNIVDLKTLSDRIKRFFMEKQKPELAQSNVNALKKGYLGVKE